MASRDKVGCPPAALPLDRVLAALAANVGQIGRRWEAAVHGRFEKADAVRGVAEGKSHAIEMHTPLFYVTCALGGVLSTGLTHLAVTPLDLVKCNMQVRGHVRQPEASACFTSRLNGG
jgi:solute carrier family 25 (mitochondrial phosphate transporter), member 3